MDESVNGFRKMGVIAICPVPAPLNLSHLQGHQTRYLKKRGPKVVRADQHKFG